MSLPEAFAFIRFSVAGGFPLRRWRLISVFIDQKVDANNHRPHSISLKSCSVEKPEVGDKVQIDDGEHAGHYEFLESNDGKVKIGHDETRHEAIISLAQYHANFDDNCR